MKATINGKRYDTEKCERLGERDHYNNGNWTGQTNLLRASNGQLLIHDDGNGQDFHFQSNLRAWQNETEYPCEADAMDYFDLSGGKLIPTGKTVDTRFLVIAFNSDWLYPAYQSRDIINFLKTHYVDATYCEIKSPYGHDAFLLDVPEQSHLIKHFLAATYKKI